MQSTEEILRLFDEWGRFYAPSNFIQNEKNAKLLLDYCLATYGLVSITYLTQATNTIAPQLDWVPQPKPKTQEELAAEFEAKEFARIEREKRENAKPFDPKRIGDAVRAEQERREQEAAERELYSLIMQFEVYKGPNRVDHMRSDAIRKDLLKVEVRRGGKRDAKLTLQAVREIINTGRWDCEHEYI